MISVATAPGMITETRTWVSISSAYRPSVKSLTAALLAPYIVWPGNGKKPPMLDTFARCASGRSTSSGRNARDMCTRAHQVHVEHPPDRGVVELGDRQERLDHPGVVEQAVDGPVRRDHGSRQRLDRGVVGDVDDVGRQPVAGSRPAGRSPRARRHSRRRRRPARPLPSIRSVSSLPIPPPAPVTTQTLPLICMG